MHEAYVETIYQRLQNVADPKARVWCSNYVKNSAPFLGVKMSAIRSILHRWHSEFIAQMLDWDQQMDLAMDLIRQEHAEVKLAGILFLQEILLPAGAIRCPRDLGRFAQLFAEGHIYDWNVCDWFCIKVLGRLIQNQGEACARAIAAWHSADNLWQARASAVPFVQVAEQDIYYPLIQESCQTLIQREERFAKTAVGWILREIWKHDEAFVRGFVTEHLTHFSVESLRNALKYASKEERDRHARSLKAK